MARYRAILLTVVLIIPCSARMITVDDNGPADYTNIQAALNASWDGDVIIVKPGTYRERVHFIGRAVTVRSTDPYDPAVVQATVITQATGSAVIFDFGEADRSVLQGFTITGRGIYCDGTSPTISRNVIRNCGGAGITGKAGAAPTIADNTIVANRLEGIYACDGLIERNTISENSAGIGFGGGLIRDNFITENGLGGGLYFCDGNISGNVISGNVAERDGGGLYSCAANVYNNVIAGNVAGRDGGGLSKCSKTIANNTIVGNAAGGRGGALSDCPGVVRNNIIAYNGAPTAGGIYGPCSNTYNAFWVNNVGHFGGGPTSGAGDIIADPLFARDGYWNTSGTDDPSDDVWVNGDYHLKSKIGRWDPQNRRWVTDQATSRCIDAGNPSSDWSAELWPHGQRINMGAYGGTPQASWSPADLGHLADLDHDARVGWSDLKMLGRRWPYTQNLLAEDLNRNGRVDLRDFARLAMDWRSGPPLASSPVPDPMTWQTKPYATGPYSIAMVATTATTTDGTGVEYFIEDYFHPEFNSGWLTFAPGQEARWEDTNLTPETTYWYRVKARNKGNLRETGWSQRAAAATTREDFTAPKPNPLTWQTEPYGVSKTTIRMVATEATDENGVEYQFECTSHPLYSSTWQDSPVYEVTSVPAGVYKFRARARDKSRNHNATGFTKEVTVDLQPPTPDPMRWEVEPKEINMGGGTFDYYATMTAVPATDAQAGVEYYFQCTTESGFSSGWQTSREYTVKVGRRGQRHRFRVKARDTSPSRNETGYSSELPSM